ALARDPPAWLRNSPRADAGWRGRTGLPARWPRVVPGQRVWRVCPWVVRKCRLSSTVSGALGLAWTNDGRVVGDCRCQPGAGRPVDCRVWLERLTDGPGTPQTSLTPLR